MIKKSIIVIMALVAILASAGCKKNCICYRYDGSADLFTEEDLENMTYISGIDTVMQGDVVTLDTTWSHYRCADMESYALGLRYSLCEKDW